MRRSVRAHGDTKTEESRRALGLPEMAVDALRAHKKRQAGERLAAGAEWSDQVASRLDCAESVTVTSGAVAEALHRQLIPRALTTPQPESSSGASLFRKLDAVRC